MNGELLLFAVCTVEVEMEKNSFNLNGLLAAISEKRKELKTNVFFY